MRGLPSHQIQGSANDLSLPKRQRSTHIHACRGDEIARMLERVASELRYCYDCFDWFVEEEWDEHCLVHIKSITSKRCASITYCNILLRPCLCPFCIGNNLLPAASRWKSWTREDKFWSHLESHLDISRWPLQCPQPLCSLQVDDQSSFLYHLGDVHSLQMSPSTRARRQEKGSPAAFITWTPDIATRKRKTGSDAELILRPSKKNKGPTVFDSSDKPSARHPLDGKAPDGLHTIAPHTLSKATATDTSAGDDQEDLPGLTHSGTTSPPNSDPLSLADDGSPDETIRQTEVYGELAWARDLLETTSNEDKLSVPDDDALFSQFIYSRSPSCAPEQGTSDDNNNDESTSSHSMDPRDVCVYAEDDHHLAKSFDHHTVNSETIPIKAKKPRITLHLRGPNPKPRPKVLLRLSEPKQDLPQKPSRRTKPGVNNRRRRRT